MQNCPHCSSNCIQKKNFYIIKHSQSKIRRYLCLDSKRSFSSKTLSPTYKQTKPFLNPLIFKLLVSGNTQRRIAKLNYLKTSEKIFKKILRLSQQMHIPCIRNSFKSTFQNQNIFQLSQGIC
jgi:transposase-like protein